jgi:hypothetical protein
MAERTITAFEAAPQGQIGSGLAQVFDTTNLVQAAVVMKEQRQKQYTQLIESLADIDPNLARPQETPAILEEFNNLYNFVVENYEDIANPMRNPEKAIEMKRKKNELLRAVNLSKALGEHELKLTGEMPKSEYFMDMYGKNSEVIKKINSTLVYKKDENGRNVFNPEAVSLLSEGLQIGKDPNSFAIELADEMKPQFDGNISYTTVGGVKLFQSTPMTLTEDDLNKVIDASLTGKTANSVAVTNSILGIEVPYDTLTDAEKDRVRNALRPLLSQRLDTKGEWKIYTPPSNFGEQKREVDIDIRSRNLIDVVVGNPDGVGLISGIKWGDAAGVVTNAGISQNGNDLVYTVQLKDGNTVSEQTYVYGRVENGKALIGEDAGNKYATNFNKLLNTANVTLNKTGAGDVKTPDFERIKTAFKDMLQGSLNEGLDLNLSSGLQYKFGDETLTLPQVQGAVRKVVKDNNTSNGRVNALKRLIQVAGFGGSVEILPSNTNDNKVILKVGNQSTDYDLDNEQQLKAFVDVVLRQTAVPSEQSGESKRMRVGTVTPFDAANDPVLGNPQQ